MRHARVTLLKKSLPIDRPKKQARLAALHAIGRMRLTILYPPNGPWKIAVGLFHQRHECVRHVVHRHLNFSEMSPIRRISLSFSSSRAIGSVFSFKNVPLVESRSVMKNF